MEALHRLLRRIPVGWRSVFYDLVGAAAFIWGLWSAAHGDWEQFALGVAGALGSQVPRANVTLIEPGPGPVDLEPQDAEADLE